MVYPTNLFGATAPWPS